MQHNPLHLEVADTSRSEKKCFYVLLHRTSLQIQLLDLCPNPAFGGAHSSLTRFNQSLSKGLRPMPPAPLYPFPCPRALNQFSVYIVVVVAMASCVTEGPHFGRSSCWGWITWFSVCQRQLLSTILRESFLGTEKPHFGTPTTLGGPRSDLGVIWGGLEAPCGPRVRFGGHFGHQMAPK